MHANIGARASQEDYVRSRALSVESRKRELFKSQSAARFAHIIDVESLYGNLLEEEDVDKSDLMQYLVDSRISVLGDEALIKYFGADGRVRSRSRRTLVTLSGLLNKAAL